MRRSTLCLILGLFCTSILVAAVSVYLFHDVDHDMIGHWNRAFVELCSESVLFALIIGVPTWLLATAGRYVFRVRNYSPRAMLSFLLGVAVTVLQYLWDYSSRILFPKLADLSLYLYLLAAIIVCTVVLLLDTLRQNKASEAARASMPVQPA